MVQNHRSRCSGIRIFHACEIDEYKQHGENKAEQLKRKDEIEQEKRIRRLEDKTHG